MFKKTVLLTLAVLSLLSLPAQAWRDDEITMLVIPREVLPLQIGQDISRRYPVILVSYQILNGSLKIHAWNGDNWVFVPVEDYTNGTFFATRPKNAIIVENERGRAPDVLTPGSLWCERAARLTSTDPRVMLHLLGLNFDFPLRYWNQLAKRYGYTLEEINPTLHNVSWWHLQGDVLTGKRDQRNFTADLNNWQPLATIPAPVIKPVAMQETAPVDKPAGATAVDITAKAPEAPVDNPAPPAEPVTIKAAVPAPEETPASETETPVPAIEPSVPAEPAPVVEPAPAVDAAPPVEPASAIEPAPMTEPDTAIGADPLAAEEIPAAEIIVPPEPKKPWWKLF